MLVNAKERESTHSRGGGQKERKKALPCPSGVHRHIHKAK